MFQQESQFYKPKDTEQKPDEVVDVTRWSIGELEIGREGKREKFEADSPTTTPYKFLLPNHHYLIKKTLTRPSGTILYEQYWNEIIAYKLGRVLGIKVPPAFVACYTVENSEPFYGALIEWFYNYSERSRRGGEVIINYINDYCTIRGEKHNFQTITEIFAQENVQNWLHEWVKILLFDAVIGNTDRHQDNWQIVEDTSSKIYFVSPAFDNGTSLGYEFSHEHINTDEKALRKHVIKGRHHMKWCLDDYNHKPTKGAKHFDLLEKIVGMHPETREVFCNILKKDISEVFDDIMMLCNFEISDARYKLSAIRADFIIKQIDYRFNHAKKVFDL